MYLNVLCPVKGSLERVWDSNPTLLKKPQPSVNAFDLCPQGQGPALEEERWGKEGMMSVKTVWDFQVPQKMYTK